MVRDEDTVMFKGEGIGISISEACDRVLEEGAQFLFLKQRWDGFHGRPVANQLNLAQIFMEEGDLERVILYDVTPKSPEKLTALAVREEMKIKQSQGHLPADLRF